MTKYHRLQPLEPEGLNGRIDLLMVCKCPSCLGLLSWGSNNVNVDSSATGPLKAKYATKNHRIGDVQKKDLDKGFNLIYVVTISLGRIFI